MPNKRLSRKWVLTSYTFWVSFFGIAGVFYELFHISGFSNAWTYIGILCLFILTEWFPLNLWKHPTTLRFPFIYLLMAFFGFPTAVVTTSLVIFLIGLMQKRPIRLWFFTPTKTAISLFAAYGLTSILFSHFSIGLSWDPAKGLIFTGSYFVVSNVLADLFLRLRFQRYSFRMFVLKNGLEAGVAFFSLGYLWSLFSAGVHFDSIKIIHFIFLLLPPLTLAVISFLALSLQKHQVRSKLLFTLTRELNRLVMSDEWRKKIEDLFRNFIDVDASGFWVKVGTDWLLYSRNGEIKTDYELPSQFKPEYAELKEIKVIKNRGKEEIPADSYFSCHLKSFIFAPLTVESDTVGMFVVARRRTNSFSPDEIRSVSTFANQAAVLLKTQNLFSEQEKRLLLEERNRIAREIHDGLAQSLAGSVMKLETAERLMETDSNKAEGMIKTVTEKLRLSLKEVRESIYELRPYLTEQIGLRRAIRGKLEEIENEGGPHIVFQEFGQVAVLDEEVKRIIYELIQESLYNCVKHADASQVWITLIYKENHVELEIKDDGVGFSLVEAMMKARNEPHFGILNMNEQAESIGGSLQIESQIGAGTTIQFKVRNDHGEVFEDDTSDVG